MPSYWVDVLDAHGVKQGDGPITSVTDWTHTALMDRAGTFVFAMPADDPRKDLLRIKRYARCWTVAGGRLQHLGAGIINDIQQNIGPDNRAMLTVSGDDLLAELLTRIIPIDTLNDTVFIHPARAGYQDVYSGTVFSRPEWIDLQPGDTATYYENNGNAVIIYAPQKFTAAQFVLRSSAQNGLNAGGIAEYWDGVEWVAFDIATNTTQIDANWFAQSGVIEWADDAVSWPDYANPNYMVRFRADTPGWLAFIVSDVTIRVMLPTSHALEKVMSYAPAGWQLDAANGYTTTATKPLSGVELITNGGFETYTGTPNDSASDAWTGWTVTQTPEHFAYVQALTTDKHGGAACVKLTTGSTYGSACITQTVDVEPATDYTLTYWIKGDGTNGQISVALHDADRATYETYYYGRFYYRDSMVTAATWTQQEVNFTTPAACTHLTLYFWNPWQLNSYALVDDVSLQPGGGGAIALDVAGETVLENLIRVSETTGEHFILSPSGRQVLWLRGNVRDSGLRCIAPSDTLAAETQRDSALIANLSEAHNGANVVSRVYPYGGGRDPIPTLRNTTRLAPSGYTLSKTGNYLERDASITAYGRIERRLDCADVANISGDPTGDTHSCNMLFDRAYVYLRRNSATNLTIDGGDVPRTYNLELLKCDRVILPGYTVRVEYDRYVEGQRRVHINNDLWVLSSTVRADANGVHTVALQCSTVDLAPVTDAQLIASLLRQQRAMQAHKAT